jgi:hypothetical protein
MTTFLNKNSSQRYVLKFNDFNYSGFLYIKWNPILLNEKISYSTHLREIFIDLKQFTTNEIVPLYSYDPINRVAVCEGFPYTLISFAREDILIGVALKLPSYAIESTLKRVLSCIEVSK